MKPIADILEQKVAAVLADIAGRPAHAIVKPTQDPRFGDYQANGVMGLAKILKAKPRDIARQVVDKLDVSDMCEPPEIAGPGFINFKLKPGWLVDRLTETARDPQRLGIDPVDNSPATVVDFSGPNIAKQMHVGHLRSTIIGDTIARTLEFWCGNSNKVIRQNHIGDWGLQIAMVLYGIYTFDLLKSIQAYGPDTKLKGPQQDKIIKKRIEGAYKDIHEELECENLETERGVRKTLSDLQNKEKSVYNLWDKVRNITLDDCQQIYEALGVKLSVNDVRGESFFSDKLPSVISELSEADLLEESDGAQCVFLEGFKTKDGDPLPLIVRKSDGAYLYATTDLAAIRYRVSELHADRIIYVTDARQKLHFEMVFSCAKKAGWVSDKTKLEHVPFGSVLGDDGKPFKTRSGENVKLKDLLDEAVTRARKIVDEKNPDLDAKDKEKIAQAVGIGAVKYADLSNNLVSDYVFDWNKMLAMEGNTAPYMQYAYARIQSIFRKGDIDSNRLTENGETITLTDPEELALAKWLLRYGEVIEAVTRDLRPHLLTTYLFDLAQSFSTFYTHCPVLKATDDVKNVRLLLCSQTARTIRHGLSLLGIRTPEKM